MHTDINYSGFADLVTRATADYGREDTSAEQVACEHAACPCDNRCIEPPSADNT